MSKQYEEKQALTQKQAQRAVEKLQAFYDSLPQDEKMVLEAVLSMAAGAEVTGHAGDVDQPIIVGSDPDTELGIFRPSNGAWYVQPTGSSPFSRGQLVTYEFNVKNHWPG